MIAGSKKLEEFDRSTVGRSLPFAGEKNGRVEGNRHEAAPPH